MSEPAARPPVVHDLKSEPLPFNATRNGFKTVELRKADRDFRVNDTLRLREYYSGCARYSGRMVEVTVSHVQTGFGLKDGYVALSCKELWIPTGGYLH